VCQDGLAKIAKDLAMPATMNISLPEPLKRFVDQQVRDGGFSGTSDYVRELIRKDRDVAKLRALLLEGASSPVVGEFESDYFATLRQRTETGGTRDDDK
jgi:antitoxin ParD1/3/4